MNNPSIFIGPMSRNVVDAVIEYCNDSETLIGLIPSRRQIEYNKGYVNNWTTREFINYVRERSSNVILQRDHGGRSQSTTADHLSSYREDAVCGLDLIHIDPWKCYTDLDEIISETTKDILLCESANPNCRYEIGTEEAIHKYDCEEFNYFLSGVKKSLGKRWSKVRYAVIQSGTAISSTSNVGVFDSQRCREMIGICHNYGLLSKEHNGDYLSITEIKKRFDLGLDAINIAPQFGVAETRQIMKSIQEDYYLLERIFQLCYDSKKWVKWFPSSFDVSTEESKKKLIEASCHYVFSLPEFIQIFDKLKVNDTDLIRNHINYISFLHEGIK